MARPIRLISLAGFLMFHSIARTALRKSKSAAVSGFFVSSTGLIVTNQHVVSDSKAEYTVYTNDGKKHPAKVVAKDPVEDVAVIKIDPLIGSSFPFLTFADSTKLELGQTVIAIGNALGEFRNTVSVGVVSGLSRSIVAGDITGSVESLNEVIQTDAAINPGNSGGPLLDLNGNVIGMNVAVAQGSQNIGFALPANLVSSAVKSVQSQGKIVRPYIGIRYVAVTDAVKADKKLSVDYGVLIEGGGSTEPAIVPGSPAAKAGLVEGDVILKVDGTKITDESALTTIIRSKKIGDKVTMTILRQGKEKTLTLELGEYPQD
jgi:serine protease Do